MNRRKALGGMLALTGLGVTSYAGLRYLKGEGTVDRGRLFDYADFIAELAEVIVPQTDSPGAKEAGVHHFIIDFLESCASDKEYANFYHGLKNLHEDCLDTYGANFLNCSVVQKHQAVERLSGSEFTMPLLAKINSKLRGRSFYGLLRSLTIEGYCTSRAGATEFLAYSPVPGKYNTNITITPNHRAWATQ